MTSAAAGSSRSGSGAGVVTEVRTSVGFEGRWGEGVATTATAVSSLFIALARHLLLFLCPLPSPHLSLFAVLLASSSPPLDNEAFTCVIFDRTGQWPLAGVCPSSKRRRTSSPDAKISYVVSHCCRRRRRRRRTVTVTIHAPPSGVLRTVLFPELAPAPMDQVAPLGTAGLPGDSQSRCAACAGVDGRVARERERECRTRYQGAVLLWL
jgi:hypothetical protein